MTLLRRSDIGPALAGCGKLCRCLICEASRAIHLDGLSPPRGSSRRQILQIRRKSLCPHRIPGLRLFDRIIGNFEHNGGMRAFTMDEIHTALGRLKNGLDRYVWLQRNLGLCDVSTDQHFQTCFNGFYRVRRGLSWRTDYFALMESAKVTGIDFPYALKEINRRTGRIEASFSKRPALFRGRHFQDVVILLCVRWYLRYSLSYLDLQEMMAERGLSIDHVTIWRWVQRYAPVLNQRVRRELRRPNRSWRVDETYVKVAGNWAYLYRAVDSTGATIEFMLSPNRDLIAAKMFLRLALCGGPRPRVINVDGHPAYPSAITALTQSGELGRRCRCRRSPYMNNIIEQDHRFIKKRITTILDLSESTE